MITRKRIRLAALLTVAMLGLSACSSGPPPRLYLLDAQTGDALTDNPEASSLQALGISQIVLPGYASDTRIASWSGNGRIVLLDAQRWAEEPEEAITRLLAERLRERASATVLIEPWPRDYRPEARIEVKFDKLLREPDGGAHLTGQIQLLSGDGRQLLQSVAFDLRSPGASMEITAFFMAVASGVDDIARTAIDTLLAMRSGS